MIIRCDRCGKPRELATGHVRRSRSLGMRLFCGRRCSGLARRAQRSKREKVALKAAYDRQYRAKNRALLKIKKADYHARTYDPDKARAVRKARGSWHTEYCRRYYADPKRKSAKVAYDMERRCRLRYGAEWLEAWRLLLELQRAINKRQSSYERRVERGYYTRSAQNRRRDAKISRW